MPWIKLRTRTIRRICYDPGDLTLEMEVKGGRVVHHEAVLPHMYEALTARKEPEFYYKYYIAPLAVSRRRTPARRFAVAATVLVAAMAAFAIYRAPDLLPDEMGNVVKMVLGERNLL